MACVLHIETATNVCSVAVSQNGELIFYREETEGPSHSSLLGVFVNEAVKEVRNKSIQLDAVAVSCGPGSYTGLRIGVSEAKGLCFGLSVPLIAIETLKVMAYRVSQESNLDKSVLLCPMLDARRMEVYDSIFTHELEKVKETAADIVDESTFAEILASQTVAFFGNGAEKCKEVIGDRNSLFIDNIYPRAKDMISLAEKAFAEKAFVDVAYYEPFYLKEFVGTIPKNKVLG